MRQELAWGAAAVAIIAAVGITQSGGKPDTTTTSRRERSGEKIVSTKAPKKGAPEIGVQPQCSDSMPLIQHFFLPEKITGPASCYVDPPAPTPLPAAYQTNFVIATLPDPLHTHFSLLFDRLVEAIQQSAQDEGYDYDSSWLPWDTEEPSFTRLEDQDEADDRTDKREDQPGILIFRSTQGEPYQKALIVFIVGEESTRGIHRPQFENAVAWINALQQTGQKRTSVAILGPSFSGSFPSLTQLLTKVEALETLNAGSGFSIYSGGASSRDAGVRFAQTKGVFFRSLVQDDMTAMDRACTYFASKDLRNLAILSEDETAYGYTVASENSSAAELKDTNDRGADKLQNSAPRATEMVCPEATNLYYPRDISTLRAAYQTQSMFNSGSNQVNADNAQRKSLPTDLIDTTGREHDTVRTYAGNQDPLSQEAQLLGIVDVLRAHRAEYVILRSSNTLDPLFLANFLRRDYPEARVVVLNSDLLFQRGQDAMALSGVMTLSTYPLFSWAREWTEFPPFNSHSHRVLPENSTEGTYIASRLLLQSLKRANHERLRLSCDFADKGATRDSREIFAPPVHCETSEKSKESAGYAPLPDYAPPYWMKSVGDQHKADKTYQPATWLSVITRNGTWPLAALNESTTLLDTKGRSETNGAHYRWPTTPRSTKIALVALCGLAVFHFLCCWFASFTAKPAFRAHFASANKRHCGLVLIGSSAIALMGLFMGWGCGIFSTAPGPLAGQWVIWGVVVSVWLVSAAALVANEITTRELNGCAISESASTIRLSVSLGLFILCTAAFFLLWVFPVESGLRLANRVFVYYRSMNLTCGVSPVVPYLSLTAGLYFWFWYALHGLALFGPDRPRLPRLAKLRVKISTPEGERELKLSMFSEENVAKPAEKIAKPLARDNIGLIVILLAVLEGLIFGLTWKTPVRSLGSLQATTYSRIFCIALGFYCSLILTEACQIWRTWSSARQLLVFLDRLPLRRTLSSLHGFSWGSVWKMSGNVLDVRYKLLSRQLECLTHLHNSLRLFHIPEKDPEKAAFSGKPLCELSVDSTRAAGAKFAEWYSEKYDKPAAGDLHDFKIFQKRVANTTGVILSELLLPASRVEKRSLVQMDPDDDCDEDRLAPPPSKNELIRNAEELVCLTYLGFAQNLLGRIRTIVLGGVYLFIALCIGVASYPFDPRTLLSGILLCLFAAFGGTVVFVYADMHRDATLSHITNTKPGELGSEFWFKVIGYGAAPMLGLVTQIFPEWSGFLFSWLQPGLTSLK